jgi:hypothetical protein
VKLCRRARVERRGAPADSRETCRSSDVVLPSSSSPTTADHVADHDHDHVDVYDHVEPLRLEAHAPREAHAP